MLHLTNKIYKDLIICQIIRNQEETLSNYPP